MGDNIIVLSVIRCRHCPLDYLVRCQHSCCPQLPISSFLVSMVVFISQQTLIIIIVCSALTAIILAILLYRFVRNCFATPKNLAPLPPVQPLAHHRGRQAATLVANRTSIWYLPTVQQPYISTVSRTSQIPLLPGDNALPPSRLVGQKFGDSEGLFIPPPLDPNPPFSLQSQSLVSVNSLDGSGAHVHARSRPQPKTSSRTGICPRPTSTISIASTHTTRNTIRGTPHGPHSQVQIVLPTPLAPDLAPLVNDEAQSRPASRYEYESDYLSVVDKWVPTNSSISNLRPSSRGKLFAFQTKS